MRPWPGTWPGPWSSSRRPFGPGPPLAGFGLDSLMEIIASTIVVWQLTGVNQCRESTALRLIGVAFLLLAIYVLGQSACVLVTGQRLGSSASGIAWPAATVAVMLLLAWGKLTTGRRLGNQVLQNGGACDPRRCLSCRGRAGRGRPERLTRLVVGRPARRPGHRLLRRARRSVSLKTCKRDQGVLLATGGAMNASEIVVFASSVSLAWSMGRHDSGRSWGPAGWTSMTLAAGLAPSW